MMKNKTSFRTCMISVVGLLTGLMMTGCNKADQQYETLYKQPEVLAYNNAYGIGDTLVMEGRLNPENDLRISIGDVDRVNILTQEKVIYNPSGVVGSGTTVDRIKIIITRQMGIGPGRPVQVTSAGNTVTAQPIEIYEDATAGYVTQPLKLTKMHTFTGGSKTLYCRSGNGNVYLWTQLSPVRSICRLSPDGALTALLSATNFTDSYGTFTITTFNGGGVDPQEHYLYFSAITTDGSTDNAANEIYRFCKVDLTTKQLTTINRTLYPKTASERTLSVLSPFEGKINEVKIFNVTGIYPDSSGNVYINKGDFLLARLDAAGNYNYLFRFSQRPSTSTTAFVPQIWNTNTSQYYEVKDVQYMFKNSTIAGAIRSIAPDDRLLYCMAPASAHDLIQYDLTNQVLLYTYEPKLMESIPYISGSFNLLTGYPASTSGNAAPLFGYMAMPGQKLLLLYYQGLSLSNFPAFGVLNFARHSGERYAPGKVNTDVFVMTASDELMNYDANGMLYMTSNSKQYILKTNNQ